MSVDRPSRFERRIPPGDNRERLVCRDCGHVHYENPTVVVGSVGLWDGRILLCRRAIEPRRGFWTIPAGFLEEHESTEAGAARETLEEAGARVEITALLGIYSIPHISQIQLLYVARLLSAEIAPGEESLEVALVRPEEIPWPRLAFPSVTWALERYAEVGGRDSFPAFSHVVGDAPAR